MRGGRNFLVCRQVGRYLRGSVVQEINSVISDWGLEDHFKVNKVDGTVTNKDNGYQIVFAGLDDVQKLKSIRPARGAFTDVRVEEATETDRQTIKQLKKRQRGGDNNTRKRLTLSFNPILQSHWIYQDYFKSIAWADDQKEFITPDLSILKTTYKDNQFLTDQDVFDLENETDKYNRDVYTLGNWGVLGNVIFTNWKVAQLNDTNSEYYLPQAQRTNRRNGLDFGFSSNPAALHRSHYDKNRKRIYVFDEFYESGLTNDVLAARLLEHIDDDDIICDSAEPKSIKELRQFGVKARGARKGKDSVRHAVQWLRQQEIILDASCINARNELMTLHYKEDANGNPTQTLADKDNHWFDATHYAYEDDMEKRTVKRGASPFQDFRG